MSFRRRVVNATALSHRVVDLQLVDRGLVQLVQQGSEGPQDVAGLVHVTEAVPELLACS
jgi:hypothetical protein